MSIKDFQSVSTFIPIHHGDIDSTKVIPATITAERDGEVIITITGDKHVNKILEMILRQELVGLATVHQPAQEGFPPDSVEVTMVDGVTNGTGEVIYEGGGVVICESHNPVQHRDGAEPWCNTCRTNADFKVPQSKINPTWNASRIGDSIRKQTGR